MTIKMHQCLHPHHQLVTMLILMTITLRVDLAINHHLIKQSLCQSLDETKRSIQKNLDEVSIQIPHYAQTIHETQEHAIHATKEIADNYIEYQNQAINSLQSIFAPYIENTNN